MALLRDLSLSLSGGLDRVCAAVGNSSAACAAGVEGVVAVEVLMAAAAAVAVPLKAGPARYIPRGRATFTGYACVCAQPDASLM